MSRRWKAAAAVAAWVGLAGCAGGAKRHEPTRSGPPPAPARGRLASGQLPARPPGPYFPLAPRDHRNCPTFRFGQRLIGTTYFYWYDIQTKAHIIDRDGTDALTDHPADLDKISWRSVGWHRKQLEDMLAAGIDFLMPVYWGVPTKYEAWSFAGLPPLVRAHDQVLHAKKRAPQIGLFYDTSTLRYNDFDGPGKSRHIDLKTDFGKDWFYTTIRDFFSFIPPAKWARIDGKPIVFLYAAAFAKAQDPALFDYVRGRFRADFGTDVFLVRHRDWQGQADAVYQWGGALGLQIDRHVAALGPGYDHSAVPGRKPLVVDRRGGAFYTEQWTKLLQMDPRRRPWMVHVETWNEFHEGTDVAESREYGRQYIALTRKFANLFHRGVRLPVSGPYTQARQVSWTPLASCGLAIRPSKGDGLWAKWTIDGVPVVVSEPSERFDGVYLYFQVDDSFLYDADDVSVELTITYRDAGCEAFAVEYDSAKLDEGIREGAFRLGSAVAVAGSGLWKTATVRLNDVRFANRTNGADFRLGIDGGERRLAVRRIVVRRNSQPH